MKTHIIIFVISLLSSITNLNSEIVFGSKVIDVSSQLSNKKNSAEQILGLPSVMLNFGSSPCAWSPEFKKDSKEEWIKVGFDKPINAQQVFFYENFNAGSVIKVILFDEKDNDYVVYDNPNRSPLCDQSMFSFSITQTPYKVSAIQLVLRPSKNESLLPQIDAVGISDTKNLISIGMNFSPLSDRFIESLNLGYPINTEYDEIAPFTSNDGKQFFFTRDGHPLNTGEIHKQDVWVSQISSENIYTEPVKLNQYINNEFNNYAFTISDSSRKLYLGNRYNDDNKMEKGISVSRLINNEWAKPKNIEIENFSNLNSAADYFISQDGNILLLSIETDDSFGGRDLYVSFKKENGHWSEPINMGNKINTADDEITPFLAPDNTTLFFSSSGHPGFGSSDIFMARRIGSSWTNWMEPENLGDKINSEEWDAYFTPVNTRDAYYCSHHNSIGLSDIFRARFKDDSLRINVTMKGKAIDSKNNQPVQSRIHIRNLNSGEELIATTSRLNGFYKQSVNKGGKYSFTINAKGYLPIYKEIDFSEVTKDTTLVTNFVLNQPKNKDTLNFRNISFDFSKYDLSDNSKYIIKLLADFLSDNIHIKVTIVGHTDDLGSETKNRVLSQKRATAVYNQLVELGIDRKRLTTIGKGFTNPICSENTEECRIKNRRVEYILNF